MVEAVLDHPPAATRLLTTPSLAALPEEPPSERLRGYREDGLPLVLNGARGPTSEIDELERDLASTFEAHVWTNVYDTGTAGTPFDVHFDTHDGQFHNAASVSTRSLHVSFAIERHGVRSGVHARTQARPSS